MPTFGIGRDAYGSHHRFIEFVAGQPTFFAEMVIFTDHTQPVNRGLAKSQAAGEQPPALGQTCDAKTDVKYQASLRDPTALAAVP